MRNAREVREGGEEDTESPTGRNPYEIMLYLFIVLLEYTCFRGEHFT